MIRNDTVSQSMKQWVIDSCYEPNGSHAGLKHLYRRAVTECRNPVDIAVVVDASAAIAPSSWPAVRRFVASFVGTLAVSSGAVRVAVVPFPGRASFAGFYLDEHGSAQRAREAVERLAYQGGLTDMRDALITLRERIFSRANGDREGVRNVAVLVMGGTQTSGAVQQAELLRADGVKVNTSPQPPLHVDGSI